MLAVGSYWRVTYMCAYMKCYLGRGDYWADQQQFKGETINHGKPSSHSQHVLESECTCAENEHAMGCRYKS